MNFVHDMFTIPIEVWDHDFITAHDFLGKCELSLHDVKEIMKLGEKGKDEELKLNTQGSLLLHVSFQEIAH